jgi:hypothetical protein
MPSLHGLTRLEETSANILIGSQEHLVIFRIENIVRNRVSSSWRKPVKQPPKAALQLLGFLCDLVPTES